MPPVVASKLWIQTIQTIENDLRTTAWYRLEEHELSLTVVLPEEAVWIRAAVAGEPMGRVERLSGSGEYLLRFPAYTASGPILVQLEYLIPAQSVSDRWFPPVLKGGVVQRTHWGVRLSPNRVIIGVPRGWTDENLWSWHVFGWRRQPRLNTTELSNWVGSAAPFPSPAAALEEEGRSSGQSFLFERPEQPTDLRLWITSEATLVLCSSLVVLMAGLIFLVVWRPPLRWMGIASLVLILTAATTVDPSIAILVLQSSVLGIILTLLAVWIHRLEERRRPSTAIFANPNPAIDAQLEDPGSTVIRVAAPRSEGDNGRPAQLSSTHDHVPMAPIMRAEQSGD